MRIESLPAVAAIASTRVWTDQLPENTTYPAVRVQFIDDSVPFHLRGPVGTDAARIQVDAFVRESDGVDVYRQVQALLEAIEGSPVRAGEIILMHDDSDHSLKLLAQLIPQWKAEGFALKAL